MGAGGGRGGPFRTGTCLMCGPSTHPTNFCELARQAIEAGRPKGPGQTSMHQVNQVNAVEEGDDDEEF